MSTDFTVGLVGAGGISPLHVTAWQSLGVRLVSYSFEGSDRLQERYGVEPVGSREELLDRCDAVDVCTPTPSHHEIALAAAAAGRPTVCEKPLGRTSAQAREMIAAFERAGVLLFPAHVVRYFPAYAAAHRAVSSGRLGELAVQRYLRMGGRPRRGWYTDTEQSGGIGYDLMIHDLDFARWTAGEVVSVFARDSGSIDDPQAAVSAHAVLTHESGAVSECTAIWRPGGAFATRFTIAGSGGRLDYDSLEHEPFALDSTADAEAASGGYLPPTGFTESPYLTEIRAFLTAFRGGPAPQVTAQDGLSAILIAEAAAESVRTGRAVAVTDAAARAEEVRR